MCKQTSLEEALINNSEPGLPRGPVMGSRVIYNISFAMFSCPLHADEWPPGRSSHFLHWAFVYYRSALIFAGTNGDGCLHGKTIPVSLLNVLPFRNISVRLLTLALLKDSYSRSKKLGLILFIWGNRSKTRYDKTRSPVFRKALTRRGWMQRKSVRRPSQHPSVRRIPYSIPYTL